MARNFSGASQTISLGDIALDGVTVFSISMWFKWDTLNNFGMMFSKFSSDSNAIEFMSGGAALGNDNEELIFEIANGSNNTRGITATGVLNLTTNTWYHALVAYNGGGSTDADRCKIFLDGTALTLTFIGAIPATAPTNASAALLGGRTTTSFHIDGQEAEVAVWVGGTPGGMAVASAAAMLARGYSPQFLRKNGLHYYPLVNSMIDVWSGNTGTTGGTTVVPHPRVIVPRGRKMMSWTVAAAGAPVYGQTLAMTMCDSMSGRGNPMGY